MVAITWESKKKYYRVHKKYISYIKFIFEAYDGIAVVTTVDAGNGIIVIYASEGFIEDVENIMADFNREFPVESIDADAYIEC